MTTLNCIVVDDEPPAIEILEKYIEKLPFLNRIASFDNSVEASIALQTQPVDLAFLDIQMPELSGVQLVKLLKGKCKVIFTTAHSQYAIDGYDHNVVDYLLKPIAFERFFQACQKVMETTLITPIAPTIERPNDAYIFVKTQNKYLKIFLYEIVYVESMGNYLTVFTLNEKLVLYGSIKDFAAKIPETQFIRVHKSYIVATEYIKSVEGNQILLGFGKNEVKIPLGEVFRAVFYQFLNSKVVN
jgi:two-component system, LytTR family, response regulator